MGVFGTTSLTMSSALLAMISCKLSGNWSEFSFKCLSTFPGVKGVMLSPSYGTGGGACGDNVVGRDGRIPDISS